MKSVSVIFRTTELGRNELAFASHLASKLGWPLLVQYTLPECCLSEKDVEEEVTRIGSFVREIATGNIPREIVFESLTGGAITTMSEGSILVSNEYADSRRLFSVLAPRLETEVQIGPEWNICIPTSDNNKSLKTIEAGILLATVLDIGVIFYHTTWHKPGLESDDPQNHVCNEAKQVLDTAQEIAQKYRVPARSVVETAPSVPEGISRCAQREGCALIVMSRANTVGRGGYADETKKRTTVPILVLGPREAGR